MISPLLKNKNFIYLSSLLLAAMVGITIREIILKPAPAPELIVISSSSQGAIDFDKLEEKLKAILGESFVSAQPFAMPSEVIGRENPFQSY